MKKILGIIIVANFSQTGYCSSPPDLNDPTWELAFSDEFNDGSINTSLWNVYNEHDHWGATNCVFLSSNVFEAGGNLTLRYKKENYSCTPPHGLPGDTWYCVRQANSGGSLIYNHTGAQVATKEAFNFEYGYVEARIKMDFASGTYPAYWTIIGDGLSGSNAAEIDIFEMLTYDPQFGTPSEIMTSNLHYTYPGADPVDGFDATNIGNWDDVYRTFAIEWNPNEIIWFIDGVEKRVYTNHEIHDPIKLLLTLTIALHASDAPTALQKDMLIDYIRVYQKKGSCGSSPTYCIFNFPSWVEEVKQNITIGCTGNTNTQPAATTQYFWVTNSMTINGEFTVPLGSTMSIQIEDDCY
jgi:beta-glucanase (GH16 family)